MTPKSFKMEELTETDRLLIHAHLMTQLDMYKECGVIESWCEVALFGLKGE